MIFNLCDRLVDVDFNFKQIQELFWTASPTGTRCRIGLYLVNSRIESNERAAIHNSNAVINNTECKNNDDTLLLGARTLKWIGRNCVDSIRVDVASKTAQLILTVIFASE